MALWAVVAALAQPAAAQEPSARTSYVLRAELDARAHHIDGEAAIDLLNTAEAPLREVVLHLYANAFASDDTVFAREGGLRLRNVPVERRGSIELTSLTTADGADLLAHAQPELVPNDRTQLRVALAAPLLPGARLELRARFRVALPSLIARMGQAGDFVMAAQWFPKLAKLMPDGSWRSTPYHGAGEFDADFADYDLTVRVPDGYVIAAPGTHEPTAPTNGATTRSERYRLERVLDIAWAAAPDLRALHYERSGDATTIDVFAPPGAAVLARRQAELAARSLAGLAAVLGPYPHRRLVVVIPPPEAIGAAGMEYPGLIVGWTASAWATLLPAASAHDVVTTHEVAHQWFPMLVASNEVDNPVLDEGLAEWLGLDLLRDRYGHASERSLLGIQAAHLLGLPLDAFDVARATLASHGGLVPSSWSRADQVGLDDLALAMYLRPAVMLEGLSDRYGRARLLRALGRYARAHRYEHVAPRDLTRALDAEYGAGFSDRVFVPALAGQRTELSKRHESAQQASAARALCARLLAFAQLVLGWVAL